jgi:transcriptional regulator GlxA family with amidase domain
MKRARRLIEEEGLDKNDVYGQVGYLDYSSFRKAYKKFIDMDK